jgi:hypothetical protein
MQYRQPHGPQLSARYQLFIRNRSGSPVPRAPRRSPRINGKTPALWHTEGQLAWYQFPAQDSAIPTAMSAGSVMVWQFKRLQERWTFNPAQNPLQGEEHLQQEHLQPVDDKR